MGGVWLWVNNETHAHSCKMSRHTKVISVLSITIITVCNEGNCNLSLWWRQRWTNLPNKSLPRQFQSDWLPCWLLRMQHLIGYYYWINYMFSCAVLLFKVYPLLKWAALSNRGLSHPISGLFDRAIVNLPLLFIHIVLLVLFPPFLLLFSRLWCSHRFDAQEDPSQWGLVYVLSPVLPCQLRLNSDTLWH